VSLQATFLNAYTQPPGILLINHFSQLVVLSVWIMYADIIDFDSFASFLEVFPSIAAAYHLMLCCMGCVCQHFNKQIMYADSSVEI